MPLITMYLKFKDGQMRHVMLKGTDFSTLSDAFIRKIQHKINRRPRKKLNFDSPKNVFFRLIANFALAS